MLSSPTCSPASEGRERAEEEGEEEGEERAEEEKSVHRSSALVVFSLSLSHQKKKKIGALQLSSLTEVK